MKHAQRRLLALLAQEGTWEVIEAILDAPQEAMTYPELAQATDLSGSLIGNRVRKLLDLGVLGRRSYHNAVFYLMDRAATETMLIACADFRQALARAAQVEGAAMEEFIRRPGPQRLHRSELTLHQGGATLTVVRSGELHLRTVPGS